MQKKWYQKIWDWLVEPIIHASWGHVLLAMLLPPVTAVTGYTLGEADYIKQDQDNLNYMLTMIVDRAEYKPENKPFVPKYDLTGIWSYEVIDYRKNYSYKGDCKIIQHPNGRLEFVEGHRDETIERGITKKHNPPKDWHSLWAQVTTDKQIRGEYLIQLDQGSAIGYVVLRPPRPPFTKLKGDYHMLTPKLFFGEVIFTKKQIM